ncbi:MAG TPA: hypothetical protein VGI27_05100, partial [Solirubrobacteraceae bacterium]
MTSALVALSSRIATNTLTAGDIAALTSALADIAPTFPVPDESGVALFSDEDEARRWIAALYTIQAGGGTSIVSLARVVSPTEITAFPAPFQPTTLGKVLFVADFTPEVSGLVLVSVNVDIESDAVGVPGLALFVVPLTAVTGGTLIAPGLTAEPTSTTPAFSAGLPMIAVEHPTFDDGSGNPNTSILVIASAPLNGTPGT